MARHRAARLISAGIAALLAAVGTAQSQEAASAYPSHNITLIVPQAAGGPPDVLARMVAAPLSEVLGKPIIVENRPAVDRQPRPVV